MSEAERDLAEAIYHEIISPESVDAALDLWTHGIGIDGGRRQRMWWVLARTSAAAIDAVLARRLSEAARTGPWGPQEEDGYPGSLLPPGWPKRGTP